MPFKSEKQRRYLWRNEPKIARKWADEEKVALSIEKPTYAQVGDPQLNNPDKTRLGRQMVETTVSATPQQARKHEDLSAKASQGVSSHYKDHKLVPYDEARHSGPRPSSGAIDTPIGDWKPRPKADIDKDKKKRLVAYDKLDKYRAQEFSKRQKTSRKLFDTAISTSDYGKDAKRARKKLKRKSAFFSKAVPVKKPLSLKALINDPDGEMAFPKKIMPRGSIVGTPKRPVTMYLPYMASAKNKSGKILDNGQW